MLSFATTADFIRRHSLRASCDAVGGEGSLAGDGIIAIHELLEQRPRVEDIVLPRFVGTEKAHVASSSKCSTARNHCVPTVADYALAVTGFS